MDSSWLAYGDRGAYASVDPSSWSSIYLVSDPGERDSTLLVRDCGEMTYVLSLFLPLFLS